MNTPDPPADMTPRCPECGRKATQQARRGVGDNMSEETAVCVVGHIWITRWFAAGEVA